jgi:hypothetical protein
VHGDGRTDGRRWPHGRLNHRRLRGSFLFRGRRYGFIGSDGREPGFDIGLGAIFDSGAGLVAVAFLMRRAALSVFRKLKAKTDAQFIGDVFIDGARVRELFRHSQFRQQVQNQVRLHLQLTCKHVDADLLHIRTKCKRGGS